MHKTQNMYWYPKWSCRRSSQLFFIMLRREEEKNFSYHPLIHFSCMPTHNFLLWLSGAVSWAISCYNRPVLSIQQHNDTPSLLAYYLAAVLFKNASLCLYYVHVAVTPSLYRFTNFSTHWSQQSHQPPTPMSALQGGIYLATAATWDSDKDKLTSFSYRISSALINNYLYFVYLSLLKLVTCSQIDKAG